MQFLCDDQDLALIADLNCKLNKKILFAGGEKSFFSAKAFIKEKDGKGYSFTGIVEF